MTDQFTTDIDVPLAEQVVIIDCPRTAKTDYKMFLATVVWFQHLSHIFNQAAIAIPGGLEALRRHWIHYYTRVAFGEEGVIMPASTLTFIINVLLAFIEIKSQGQPEFPFHTHPRNSMFSVTSLLMYGLASAVLLNLFSLLEVLITLRFMSLLLTWEGLVLCAVWLYLCHFCSMFDTCHILVDISCNAYLASLLSLTSIVEKPN